MRRIINSWHNVSLGLAVFATETPFSESFWHRFPQMSMRVLMKIMEPDSTKWNR